MSMTVKMLDEAGKGFRLVTVDEPVDIQVISGDQPRLVIHQAIASLTRGFPLVNNAYIMNAAGETVSKIDYKEVKSGQPGIGNFYCEAMTGNTATISLGGMLGVDPKEITDEIRDAFLKTYPHLREALDKTSQEVVRDFGTILANFKDYGDGTIYGAYLEGTFWEANKLTTKQIGEYGVYAKEDVIKHLRDTGMYPESKLSMLASNDKLVNAKPEPDGEAPAPEGPKSEADLWVDVIGHLDSGLVAPAMGSINTLTMGDRIDIYGAVVSNDNYKEFFIITGNKIHIMYSGDKVYRAEDVADHTSELFGCYKSQEPKCKWYHFSRDGMSVRVSPLDPSKDSVPAFFK